jgi:vanillate O-demethylase monooxygenase subunit
VHEAEEGGSPGEPSKGKLLLDTFSSQAVTPRDEGSVDYYFSWGTSRETAFPGIVDLMHRTNMDAFLEDKRILEGQRERLVQYPDAPQVDIVHDAGPGRMLWVLDQLLEEEAAERGAAERSVDQGQAA